MYKLLESGVGSGAQAMAHYSLFTNVFLVLRVTTGENWQEVMLSCKKNSPCESKPEHNCGSDATYFFYPFFYAIASILVRNTILCSMQTQ